MARTTPSGDDAKVDSHVLLQQGVLSIEITQADIAPLMRLVELEEAAVGAVAERSRRGSGSIVPLVEGEASTVEVQPFSGTLRKLKRLLQRSCDAVVVFSVGREPAGRLTSRSLEARLGSVPAFARIHEAALHRSSATHGASSSRGPNTGVRTVEISRAIHPVVERSESEQEKVGTGRFGESGRTAPTPSASRRSSLASPAAMKLDVGGNTVGLDVTEEHPENVVARRSRRASLSTALMHAAAGRASSKGENVTLLRREEALIFRTQIEAASLRPNWRQLFRLRLYSMQPDTAVLISLFAFASNSELGVEEEEEEEGEDVESGLPDEPISQEPHEPVSPGSSLHRHATPDGSLRLPPDSAQSSRRDRARQAKLAAQRLRKPYLLGTAVLRIGRALFSVPDNTRHEAKMYRAPSAMGDPLRGWFFLPASVMTLAHVAPFLPVHRNDEPATQVFGPSPGATGSWLAGARDPGMGEIAAGGGIAQRPTPVWLLGDRLVTQSSLRGRLLQWSSAAYRWALFSQATAITSPGPLASDLSSMRRRALKITRNALRARGQASELIIPPGFVVEDEEEGDALLTQEKLLLDRLSSPLSAERKADASAVTTPRNRPSLHGPPLSPGIQLLQNNRAGAEALAELVRVRSCATEVLARRMHLAALIGVESSTLQGGAPETWYLAHEGAPVRLQEDRSGRMAPDGACGVVSAQLGESVMDEVALRSPRGGGEALPEIKEAASMDGSDEDEDGGFSRMVLKMGSVAGGDSDDELDVRQEDYPLGLAPTVTPLEVRIASRDRRVLADEATRGGTLERLYGPASRAVTLQRSRRVKRYNARGAGSQGRFATLSIAKSEPAVTALLPPRACPRPVFSEMDLLLAPPAHLHQAMRPEIQRLVKESLEAGAASRVPMVELARAYRIPDNRRQPRPGDPTTRTHNRAFSSGTSLFSSFRTASEPVKAVETASPGPAMLRIRWRYDVDTFPEATRGAEALYSIGIRRDHALALLPNRDLALIGLSTEQCKSNDIVRHLPILKPLFHHVAGIAERRVNALGTDVFATIKGQRHEPPKPTAPASKPPPAPAARKRVVQVPVRSPTSSPFPRSDRGKLTQRVAKRVMGRLRMLKLMGVDAEGGDAAKKHEEALSIAQQRRTRTNAGKQKATTTMMATTADGLEEFVFVGLLEKLTNLPRAALASAFRRIDANADNVVTFSEIIAFLLREADVAISFKAAQDSYMLESAPIADPTSTATIGRPGGLLAMVPLSSLQGYAFAFADGALRVLDDALRPGLALNSATVPPPAKDCLPFETVPPTVKGQRLLRDAGPRKERGVQVISQDDAEIARERESREAEERATMNRERKSDQLKRIEQSRMKVSAKEKKLMAQTRRSREVEGKFVVDDTGRELTVGEVRQLARALQLRLVGKAEEPTSASGQMPMGEGARTVLAMTFDLERSRLLAARADRRVLCYDLSQFRSEGSTPLREIASQNVVLAAAASQRRVEDARMSALAAAAAKSQGARADAGFGGKGLIGSDGVATGRAAIALANAAGLGKGVRHPGTAQHWLSLEERRELHHGPTDSEEADPITFALRVEQARIAVLKTLGSDATNLVEDEEELIAQKLARQPKGHLRRQRERGAAPPDASFVASADDPQVIGDTADGGGPLRTGAASAVAALLSSNKKNAAGVTDSSEVGSAVGTGLTRLTNSGKISSGPRVRASGDAELTVQIGRDTAVETSFDDRGLFRGTTRGGGIGAALPTSERFCPFDLPLSVREAEAAVVREAGMSTAQRRGAVAGRVRGDGVRAGSTGVGTELALGRSNGVEISVMDETTGQLRTLEALGPADEVDERDVARIITGAIDKAGEGEGANSFIVQCSMTFGVGPGIPTSLLVAATDLATRAGMEEDSFAAARSKQLYVVGDAAGWVTFYECETGKLDGGCELELEGISGMVAVPGLGVVVAGHGGGLQVVDPRTAIVTRRFNASHPLGITAVTYCAGEQLLVTSGYDSRLLCWDAHGSTPFPVAELAAAAPPTIKALQTLEQRSATDRAVVTGLADGLVDTTDGDRVVALTVAEAHSMIVSVTARGHIDVHDPKTLQLVQKLQDRLTRRVRGVIVDPQRLSVVTFGSHVRLWRIREVDGNTLTAAQAALRAVAATPGSALAAAQRIDTNRDLAVPERRVVMADPGVAELGISTGGAASLETALEASVQRAASPRQRPSGLTIDTQHASPDAPIASSPAVVGEASRAENVLSDLVVSTQTTVGNHAHTRRESAVIMAGLPNAGAPPEPAVQEAIELARRQLQVRRGSVEERAVQNLVVETTERALQLRVSEADAILAALYSSAFGVIITVRYGGRVATWDVRTGEVRATFRVSHSKQATELQEKGSDASGAKPARLGASFTSPPVELTCAALDAHGRRLITGGIDGTVRMWSISNGDLVRSVESIDAEITCLAYHRAVGLTRSVVAGAWNGLVAFWRDAAVDPAEKGGSDAVSEEAEEAIEAMDIPVLDDQEMEAFLDDYDAGSGKPDRSITQQRAARTIVDGAISNRAILAGFADARANERRGRTVPKWRPATGDSSTRGGILSRRVDAVKGKIDISRSAWGGGGLTAKQLMGLQRTLARVRRRRPSVEGDQICRNVDLRVFDEQEDDEEDGEPAMLKQRASQRASGVHILVVPPPLKEASALGEVQVGRSRVRTRSVSEIVSASQWAKALRAALKSKMEEARRQEEQFSREIEMRISKEGREHVGTVAKRGASSASPRPTPASAGRSTRPRTALRATDHHVPSAIVPSRPESSVSARLEALARPQTAISGFSALGIPLSLDPRPIMPSLVGVGATDEGSTPIETVRVDHILNTATALANLMDEIVFGGSGAARRNSQRAAQSSMHADGKPRGDVLCVICGGGRPIEQKDALLELHDARMDEAQSFMSRVGGSGTGIGSPWVVTGSVDGMLCVWDASTERVTHHHHVHDPSGIGTLRPAGVWSLCALPDQKTVLVGTDSGCLHVLDIATGGMVEHPMAFEQMSPRESPSPQGAKGRWDKARSALGSATKLTGVAGTVKGQEQNVARVRTSFRPLPLHEEWGATNAQGLTAIAVDGLGHVALVGYSKGWARLFNVSSVATNPTALEDPLQEWQLSGGGFSIRSIQFMEIPGAPPLFVSAAGVEVCLLSLQGSHIARLGQSTLWPKGLAQDRKARMLHRASLALGLSSAEEVAGAARRGSMMLRNLPRSPEGRAARRSPEEDSPMAPSARDLSDVGWRERAPTEITDMGADLAADLGNGWDDGPSGAEKAWLTVPSSRRARRRKQATTAPAQASVLAPATKAPCASSAALRAGTPAARYLPPEPIVSQYAEEELRLVARDVEASDRGEVSASEQLQVTFTPMRPHRPDQVRPPPRVAAGRGRQGRVTTLATEHAREVAAIVAPPLRESEAMGSRDAAQDEGAGQPVPRHARIQREYMGYGVWKKLPVDSALNRIRGHIES
jgi:WD40 repeat protein